MLVLRLEKYLKPFKRRKEKTKLDVLWTTKFSRTKCFYTKWFWRNYCAFRPNIWKAKWEINLSFLLNRLCRKGDNTVMCRTAQKSPWTSNKLILIFLLLFTINPVWEISVPIKKLKQGQVRLKNNFQPLKISFLRSFGSMLFGLKPWGQSVNFRRKGQNRAVCDSDPNQ